MVKRNIKDAIIPSKTEGSEMVKIDCPECAKTQRPHEFTYNCTGKFILKGRIICQACKNERQFESEGEYLRILGTILPPTTLSSKVPGDIKDDVKEVERAYLGQCYKASAAMCRRATQIALIEKGIKDRGLEAMINEAKDQNILSNDTYNFAKSIKGFGDIAVHRKEIIEPGDIPLLLSCIKRMLNELFPE